MAPNWSEDVTVAEALKMADEDDFHAHLAPQQHELKALAAEVRRLTKVKDGAYAERNLLVAALSKIFPASLERHEGVDWEDDWRWVLFVDLPAGQASWHIHDSELPNFAHLPRNAGRRWDGHTNEEKYRRLAALDGSAL